MPERIQRKRTKGWKMPPNTVYVGRPTKWGNPFEIDSDCVAIHCLSMGVDGSDRKDRATAATDLFRTWVSGGKVNELVALHIPKLPAKPLIRHMQRDLAGKNLACFCPEGQSCHADVLRELANASAIIPQDGSETS